MTDNVASNPGAPLPTPETSALLARGEAQLAKSRRLISEIEAMVSPEAEWPHPDRPTDEGHQV